MTLMSFKDSWASLAAFKTFHKQSVLVSWTTLADTKVWDFGEFVSRRVSHFTWKAWGWVLFRQTCFFHYFFRWNVEIGIWCLDSNFHIRNSVALPKNVIEGFIPDRQQWRKLMVFGGHCHRQLFGLATLQALVS